MEGKFTKIEEYQQIRQENDITMDVISTQPTQKSDMEQYLLDLDSKQVGSWSAEEVASHFLEKINCGNVSKQFLTNKIDGQILFMLQEEHLKEIGVSVIGERLYILKQISVLKKKKKEMDSTATLWSGETPTGGCAYSDNFIQYCQQKCCPCCVAKAYWKVTPQGVFHQRVPPCGRICCRTVTTDFMDYRFFKDIDVKKERDCCCGDRYMLEMYVNDADQEKASTFISHTLLHPHAEKVEQIIRNQWSAATILR